MLITTVSSQVFVTDEVLAINKVGSVEDGDELIEKYGKLSKTRNCLSPKNWLSQEKNCQKVGIYLNSILKKTS